MKTYTLWKRNKKNTGSVLNFNTRLEVVEFVKSTGIKAENIVVRKTENLGDITNIGNNIAKSIYAEAHK